MLKLYYDLMSQPSRAVYMFLKLNNIPFVDKKVALRKGEHYTEEYKKINPFQKVPVIDHDGFILTESIAILKYLANVYSVPDHWFPKDLKKQTRIEEYLSWQHHNTRLHASIYFRTKVIDPRATGEPVNEQKLERFRQDLEVTLNHIENVFLKNTPYLNSHEISIADLLGVCELMQPIAAGYDFTKNRPVLRNYMDKVRNEVQPRFDEAHQMIYKLKSVFQAQSKM